VALNCTLVHTLSVNNVNLTPGLPDPGGAVCRIVACIVQPGAGPALVDLLHLLGGAGQPLIAGNGGSLVRG
jgi:hypothetical protein